MVKIILGIDPGTTQRNPTGYAIINNEKMELKKSGIVYFTKGSEHKIWELVHSMEKIFMEFDITECAIEKPFSPNPDSLAKINHFIGGIEYVAAYFDVPISYYSPPHIKKQATGNGRASKEEVQKVVKEKFNLEEVQKDEADAIATGLTHITHLEQE